MKLSLVVVITQIVAGVFAQEVEQGERGLLFGFLTSLLFRTKPPTQRPTVMPTPPPTVKPTPPPTEKPTLPPTDPPTPRPTLLPTDPPTTRPSLRPTAMPTVKAVPPPAPSPSPQAIADHMKLVDAKIRATITKNPNIAATYLRLGFHDCVPNGAAGGCDGCISLTNKSNAGLLPAVEALAPIVAEFENKVLGVSRADIWAYAALCGAEVSQSEIVFTDSFLVGRKNCETVGTCSSTDPSFCASNGPDQPADFPETEFTTHQLLTFMFDHFGFNADETVAIMGAHSIGRARPENTGYEGREGWDNDPLKLDNEYYQALIASHPDAPADGPDWFPVQVISTGEWQWVPAGTGDPQLGTQGFPTYLFGGKAGSGKFTSPSRVVDPVRTGWQWLGKTDDPPLMLNVDIGLVRDLENKLDAGKPLCSFRFPEQKKCPVAETLGQAEFYKENNIAWLADFKKVLIMMLKKGMN